MRLVWNIVFALLIVVGFSVCGASIVEDNKEIALRCYRFSGYDLELIEEILKEQEAQALILRPQDERLIKADHAKRRAMARAIAVTYVGKSKALDKALDSK